MTGCSNCDNGWKHLTEATVEHTYPEPEPTVDQDPAELERLMAEWRSNVAAARNTWYPCRDCNEPAFWRWAGGHWQSDHDRGACMICSDIGPGRHRRKSKTKPEVELTVSGPAAARDPSEPQREERF